ncbi:MAG: CotH kinase family protein [Eubacteriales bacterium]|nr:CotH kinase family protein [Eubacteriales bacterium]
MLAHKHITKIVAVIVTVAVVLCLSAMMFADQLMENAGGTGVSMEYESKLFDTSEIMSVNIIMDESQWDEMLQNATAETYYQCDVEINGTMFYRVGIRPKGNTSLTSIASDPTTDRYSLKLEFDQFVDGQTCFGLDKLILNNNYADITNMKEALIYDMYQYLGSDASLYDYAKISVNGEYWGVYLALEAVEDSFMMRNYGVSSGELYKPDSMNIGGGMGGGLNAGDTDFSQMAPPNQSDREETPKSDFDFSDIGGMFGSIMGGGGADLNYTDDDLDSYSTIWDGEVTRTGTSDHKRVVKALKNISEGNDLEQYMDVDNLLKYMAVHVFSVNSDSLSGMMAHNYYLYEENGRLNLIPWDYNLSLGGMGSSSDATSVVNDAIDNAFSGTEFFDTLMEKEEYHTQYYAYLQQLVDEYLLGDGFEIFYQHTRNQIDELVETDPTAFYTSNEYLNAVDILYQVVKLRGESIDGQVNGSIPSTASEQKGSDALIDASSLDLSAMGSMSMGGGGGFNFTKSSSESQGSSTDSKSESSDNTDSAPSSGTMRNMPEGFDPSQFDGEIPEGFDSSQFSGEMPEGFDSSQLGSPPDSTGSKQVEPEKKGTDESNESAGNITSEMPSFGGMSGMPGGGNTSNNVSTIKNAVTYGVCFVILLAALLFAKLYRRRIHRR